MKAVFASLGSPELWVDGAPAARDGDLPLGAGAVRAYARSRPSISRRAAFVNRSVPLSEPAAAAAEALAAEAPDLAAFGCYAWNAERTLEACRRLKALRPGTLIVLGGPEVPRAPAEARAYLEAHPEADFLVAGEGEEPFAHLLEDLLDGRTPPPVSYSAPSRRLEGLPSPYLTGDIALRPGWTGLVTLETSRGCPYECSYCDYQGSRRGVAAFPLARFAAELELLERLDHRGPVYLADPVLNLRREHALQAFRLMARHRFRFMLELMAEALDEELLAAYRAIPGARARAGVQSVNPAALKAVRRGFDAAKAAAGISGLAASPGGVTVEAILGLPGDDYDGFKRTLDWCLSLRPPAALTVFDLVVLPNTSLARESARHGLRVDGRRLVLETATFDAESLERAGALRQAYYSVRRHPRSARRFHELVDRGHGPPSRLLERVAAALRSRGELPEGRLLDGDGEPRGGGTLVAPELLERCAREAAA